MSKLKVFLVLLFDVAFFYLSLFLALFIRQYPYYQAHFFYEHFFPFSIILVITIVSFYIIGLYDLRQFKNNINFVKNFSLGIVITFIFALALFYLVPIFGITPRFNLLLFTLIFAISDFLLRLIFNNIFKRQYINTFFVGTSLKIEEIKNFLSQSPQLGYKIKGEGLTLPTPYFIQQEKIDLIVVDNKKEKDVPLNYFNLGIDIQSVQKFYENIFQKIPLEALDENWFFENIINRKPIYQAIKNIFEFVSAVLLLIILSPLLLLISLLIKLTSEGPALYKQKRVGKNGKVFTLYKFRTMIKDAEKYGIKKDNEEDWRVTKIGKILRKTHLDELPQLWNIIKGELSFVGPRPERPEFVEEFKQKIPFYEIRLIVKPGLTGWAQINFPHGLTLDDAYQKLEYDIFYIKNRSLILDMLIMIKTIRSFFTNPTHKKDGKN